jgi:hypothetical protein
MIQHPGPSNRANDIDSKENEQTWRQSKLLCMKMGFGTRFKACVLFSGQVGFNLLHLSLRT